MPSSQPARSTAAATLRSALRSVFSPVFFLTLLAPVTLAQTASGTLVGHITDVQNQPLQGARVVLSPGGSSASTDSQGNYSVFGLAPGSYSVAVSYVGFSPALAISELPSGGTAHVDLTLKVNSVSEDVQVYSGRQGGEIESINRTVAADNIINVLPADVIKSLPNANVADAIGRLPSVTLERDEGEGKYIQVRGTEPRLTNTTVDGVNIASAETVRQVKLDIIPADLVESVQINKTLEANMPGDGIGGSVDLRTKSAGDQPTVALEGTGGYTPILGGRPAYQYDGTLGKRFFKNKLGLLGGGSYDWNGRGINDVEPAPVQLGGYDQRDYQYYRSRLGFAGTVDYSFNDTSSLYLKGLYSLFHNYGNRWDYNLATTFTQAGQPDGKGSISFGAEIRRPVQDLGSLQLGGRHVIFKRSLLSWDTETSVGRTRDNGYADASFTPRSTSSLNAIQYGLDNSNPLVPKLSAPEGVNLFDPAQYVYTGQRVNNYYSPETDLGFGVSLSTSYTAGGHAGTLELGGRFRNVHKFANQDTRYTVPLAGESSPTLSMTNFVGSFIDPSYYGGSYVFGPTVNYDTVKAFTAVGPDSEKPDVTGNNFNFIEKVSAGYVRNSITVSKFRIVGGLRFENTSDHDAGTVPVDAPPVPTRGSYLDVLPGVSVRYGFAPNQALRFAYGRGLSRPDFADLVSFASVSPGGVRTTSSIGNPNLKAEHADNFDLLYERNLSPAGLLQAGVYGKRLSTPIIALQTTLSDGTIQTQPQNAGSAYVYGFEIAFQQHFTYLPGLLGDTGLSANYGYSASQVSFPSQSTLPDGSVNIDRDDHPDLLRQAPHTWNISPTFDRRGLSVRLGLSYNAANIFAYQYSNSNAGPIVYTKSAKDTSTTDTGYTASGGGLRGPNGDNYLYAHLQVDLQGSYRLPKGFSVIGYGLNLNNEVFGFYNGSKIYPIQREFYKPTVGGGLRWSPSREK